MHHSIDSLKTPHLDFIVKDTTYFDDTVGGIFGAFPKQHEISENDVKVVQRQNTITLLRFK